MDSHSKKLIEDKGYRDITDPKNEELLKSIVEENETMKDIVSELMFYRFAIVSIERWYNKQSYFCSFLNPYFNVDFLINEGKKNGANDEFDGEYIDFLEHWERVSFFDVRVWNSLKYYVNLYKKYIYSKDKEDVFFAMGRLNAIFFLEQKYSMLLSLYKLMPQKEKGLFNQEIKFDKSSALSVRPPKVDFIILKETGEIDKILSENANNNTKSAEKIAEKINRQYISFVDFKVDVTSAYIKNILVSDSFNPDYTSAKSAYNKKNVKQAVEYLNKIGVKTEDCLYFPEIKKEKPDWFD